MANYCGNCGAPIREEYKFCSKCGMELERDPAIPAAQTRACHAKNKKQRNRRSSPINIFMLLLVTACIVIWFTTPLVAVNYLTAGNQPTGWMLFTDDDFYLGDLTDSPVFWLCAGCLAGLIICFISVLLGTPIVGLVASLLSEACLGAEAIYVYQGVGRDLDLFWTCFGTGFWIIAAGLLVIIIVCLVCLTINGNRSKI